MSQEVTCERIPTNIGSLKNTAASEPKLQSHGLNLKKFNSIHK